MNKLAHMNARLRAVFFVVIMAFALSLTACGGKDKKAKKKTADYGTMVVASMEAKAVAPRSVSEEEAERALAAFGFGKADEGPISWSARSGSGGNYQFTDFKMSFDDGAEVISISKLSLAGLYMNDDAPMFDEMVADNVRISTGNYETAIKQIILGTPSEKLAGLPWSGFTENMQIALNTAAAYKEPFMDHFVKTATGEKIEETEDIFSLGPFDGYGFGKIRVENLTIRNDRNNLNFELFDAGVATDGTGFYTLKDINFTDLDAGDVKIHFGLSNASGLNLAKSRAMFLSHLRQYQIRYDGKIITNEDIALAADPYEPYYVSSVGEDMDIDIYGLKLTGATSSAQTYRQGDVVTQILEMTPVEFTWPQQVDDKDIQNAITVMSDLGYSEIKIDMHASQSMNERDDTMTGFFEYQIIDVASMSGSYDWAGVKKGVMAITKYTDSAFKQPEDWTIEEIREIFSAFTKLDMQFTYTDHSVIDRGFKYASESEEMSVDLLKGKAKAGVSMLPMVAQDDAQRKLLNDMVAAFIHLIDESGSVTFDFKPKMPIDVDAVVADLEKGEFNVEILGLTISHQ